MSIDFAQLEEVDGTRWTWLFWPTTKAAASQCVLPFACLFTPLRPLPNMPPPLPYPPVTSREGTVLNPYCSVDINARMWVCPFTFQRNQLPPQYASIPDNQLPSELIPEYTVVEYRLNRPPAPPPAFLFVLDTTVPEKQFTVVKEYLLKALSLLPPGTTVGLITYGQHLQVHEIGFTEGFRSYILRGNKSYDAASLQPLLGLGGASAAAGAGASAAAKQRADATAAGAHSKLAPPDRFLQPIQECEYMMATLLEGLQRDAWPVPAEERPKRCTGAALAAAAALLECTYRGYGAHICLLQGGPCTEGPGTIVGPKLDEELRSHIDIEKDNAPHLKKALKHYDEVATRLVNAGHALSVFGCSLDQVGFYEMKACVDRTGGVFVMAESFEHDMFKRSFEKFFECDENGHLKRHFLATLEVDCSREFKIAGVIGPSASLEKKGPSVSTDTEIGIGGTCAWRIGSISPDTSLSVFFDVVNQQSNGIPENHYRYIQFRTTYQHSSGEFRMRVATHAGRWCDGNDLVTLAAGFDQEAAAVTMARLAAFRTENEEAFDILRWLDRLLIRLCARFGDYQKERPETFRLGPSMSFYPQFMYHLRRSALLQTFNTSPDESAFFRSHLCRVSTADGMLMIQPSLIQYSLESAPTPVLLDVASVRPDVVLFLDAFFYIVIFYGDTVAQWRKAGYHLQPNYRNLAELLEIPRRDAAACIAARFPYPRWVESDQYGSQARFLLAKLNPSATHTSGNVDVLSGSAAAEFIYTDDVSMEIFLEHLRRATVATT
jgi:protein transport protein SEC23